MSDPTITCPKCHAEIKLTESLDKERKSMTRLWSKREEQIRCVIEATAGMYGDLRGIAGRSLQEIDGLEVKAIEGGGEVNGEG